MSSENTRRIAKNTGMLYIRMFLIMGVTLYTSRVVLEVLGVEDYGIYNVVGGLVVMFNFLNSSMAIAVQRYLSFEMGRGNWGKLNHIFSLSLVVHGVLALIVVITAGGVGYWLLESMLNIPESKRVAAWWVFVFSIFGCCANIVRIPYNAVIIAREKMNVYAYISILEVVLSLGVAFLLLWIPSDKLKLYAILICGVSCLVTGGYWIYCRSKFVEARFRVFWNKSLFKELMSFAGWSAIGELSWVATIQGVNLVLNIFFNPVVNAARGISYQVTGALNRFVSSFQTAVNPQLIKYFAANEKEQMFVLLFRSTNFSFYLLLFFALPLVLETEEVLRLWLRNVPDYTVLFCRLAIVNVMLDSLSNLLATAAKAYGRIRTYQMWVSLFLFANLPLSYLFLRWGMPPEYTFYIYGCISVFLLIIRTFLLHRMIHLPVIRFGKEILNVFVVALVASIVPMVVYWEMPVGFLRLFVVTFVSIFSVGMSVYFIGLKKGERMLFKNKLLNFMRM
ncbi:lipopolysaccharide biosynthesis protein [Odoribacter lunatus]|uniref:lipopolysaccharide biosynthesis protein n=1 Tax=Odoribacter lunatus TaxID=2941335 RepID=UPI00203D467C|nr:lipopolysaccharide biosynthesis protein [Odoribacter lunatus]